MPQLKIEFIKSVHLRVQQISYQNYTQLAGLYSHKITNNIKHFRSNYSLQYACLPVQNLNTKLLKK